MKKKIKLLLLVLLTILLICIGAFTIYVSDYYKADKAVKAELTASLSDGSVTASDKLLIFHAGNDSGSALIFYPGGKVEAAAYYPLLREIAAQGITCVLVKMPFHLAVFDSSAADQVYEKLPDIKSWYIGGHSLGGAMASSYMEKHQNKLNGLILMGAYIYGDIDPAKALTLYGSNDLVLNRSKITYDENIVVIEGGNHAYYGNYGEQRGDGTASVTREEQQAAVVKAVVNFIAGRL